MAEDQLTLTLPVVVRNEIWAHCEAGYPEEAAGLLLGSGSGQARHVSEILPLPNVFAEDARRTRYQISPEAMIAAEDAADAKGLQVVGVFHSHPDHPPSPSEFDHRQALPWFVYLITSVMDGRAEQDRAWKLDDDRGHFDEVTLEVLELRQST